MNRFQLSATNISIQSKKKLLYVYIFIILAVILIPILMINLTIQQQTTFYPEPYSFYVRQYAKRYTPIQQTYRKFVFYQTYNDIIFHNKKQLDASYIKGINEFSDLTKQQFQQLYHIVTQIAITKEYTEIADFAYDSYDWSEKYLPPIVKNQKAYDVGHVFATVAMLQFWVNKNKQQDQKWVTLSEQEIIDCCMNCGVGQQPHKVLKYIIQNGISTDENYPYKNSVYIQQKQQCKTKNLPKPYKPIKDFQRIKNCKDLALAIQKGPVVVGVDASQFKDYEYGILKDCGTKRSHYMLLVGKGIGYWKLKNSWGQRWGERGYIRLRFGNTCAICLHGYRAIFVQSS